MRPTIASMRARVDAGERLTMVTAYDYTSARLVARTEIPLILVGDSLGMVVQGHETTIPVTVDHVVYHAAMVTRGAPETFVVADLPFLTYTTPADALRHAGRLLAEGGAQCVKLEGGVAVRDQIGALVQAGVPVMGHVGFTPQSVHTLGLTVQGKTVERAVQVFRDALAVQEAGAWAVVLEVVPAPLAAAITERLDIPTIGIGAGPHCCGEVQVWHDILGLYEDFQPRHSRRFAELGRDAVEALRSYDEAVRERAFPTDRQSSGLDEDTLAQVMARMEER